MSRYFCAGPRTPDDDFPAHNVFRAPGPRPHALSRDLARPPAAPRQRGAPISFHWKWAVPTDSFQRPGAHTAARSRVFRDQPVNARLTPAVPTAYEQRTNVRAHGVSAVRQFKAVCPNSRAIMLAILVDQNFHLIPPEHHLAAAAERRR